MHSRLRIIVLAVMGLAAQLAYADDPPIPPTPIVPAHDDGGEIERLKAREQNLEDRVTAAEARADEAQKKSAETQAQDQKALKHAVSFSAAPGKGLTLTVGDDKFSLSLRSRAQVRDTVSIQGGQPTTNEINVKTARLWLQGFVLTKDLQYGIQLAFGGNDFDPGSSSPIFDAFIDYGRLRDLHIKVGQFFVPFDRSRTIREFALQLVDRPQLVSELSLDRDVGLSVYSNDLGGFHGIFGYALGIFGGEGKNRFGGAAVGFLYTARIVVRPFGPFDDDIEGDLSRLKRPRLAIGFAGAYNQNTSRQKSTTGNVLTLGTFDYVHADADVVFKYAGFSFLGEFLYRQAGNDVNSGDVNGMATKEYSRSALGYLLQAGMMLHDKVEVAARYDDIRALSQTTDPTLIALANKTGKELGGGLNVYLNGHAFKIQSDYVYLCGDSIHGGKHAVRLQLDASF